MYASRVRSTGCFEIERTHVLKHKLRVHVSRTECVPRQSQRVAEELLALCLQAAQRERERDRQGGRRDQRLLVLGAEQAGRREDDLALDLRSFGLLALP